jgi:hypothetical protein
MKTYRWHNNFLESTIKDRKYSFKEQNLGEWVEFMGRCYRESYMSLVRVQTEAVQV